MSPLPSTEFDDAALAAWEKEVVRLRRAYRERDKEVRQKFLDGRERATKYLDEFVKGAGLDKLAPAEWFVYDWYLVQRESTSASVLTRGSSEAQWMVVHPSHSSVWFKVTRTRGCYGQLNNDGMTWTYTAAIVEGGVPDSHPGRASNWKVKVERVTRLEDVGEYLASRDKEKASQ